MKNDTAQRQPLSREDKEALLFAIRRALLARGFRQMNPSCFEGTSRHGTYQVFFTACSVEKQILRCEFEYAPGTRDANIRPKNTNYPYWWEDYGYGWLDQLSVDKQHNIRGMVRYKGVAR